MPSLQYKIFSGLVSKIPLKPRLKLLYFRRFKKKLDFGNIKTFNEKIQLKKINDRSVLLTIAADKIASKDFVEKICPSLYIPKTLWRTDSSEELDNLDLSQLPKDYVYKANHTSQTIEIIREGKHLAKSQMKKLANTWLEHDQSASLGEWAYQNIPRKVFIEEFLDFEGQAPDDYKFFVYHGKVHFIQLDSDRFTNHKRNMFDSNWHDLGFEYSHSRKYPAPEKPPFLQQMIDISEEIGQHFDFIRVDLYYYSDKVTFGELTVYPGAGFEKFPNKNFDLMFGKPWNI
ncbi:ATP-grasp fold amidoligase family protein [Vibrio breoganii]|uniref:ATP-grasp fold amidoligase family protein n=1 Tax=Vibrio breoganii TaxID=553239 RepID=UPI000C85CAAB|nr:ATP-grasp fold amidoligase family protein [Vibrio breoganii]PMK51038.1 hypothetical protein BCT97_18475 [Vibrio breoganii]PMO29325.1 hypothetical protein BCT14_06345 [Vibrio breoganii]